MRYKRIVVLTLGLLFALCLCACGAVFLYGYVHGDWSDFSTLDSASDVESALKEKLTIGESTITDVVSFLTASGVNYCGIYKEGRRQGGMFLQEEPAPETELSNAQTGNVLIPCITGIRESVSDLFHHVWNSDHNLLIEYEYYMQFYFVDGVLVDIQVAEVDSGL